jgi:hypothetical protein
LSHLLLVLLCFFSSSIFLFHTCWVWLAI